MLIFCARCSCRKTAVGLVCRLCTGAVACFMYRIGCTCGEPTHALKGAPGKAFRRGCVRPVRGLSAFRVEPRERLLRRSWHADKIMVASLTESCSDSTWGCIGRIKTSVSCCKRMSSDGSHSAAAFTKRPCCCESWSYACAACPGENTEIGAGPLALLLRRAQGVGAVTARSDLEPAPPDEVPVRDKPRRLLSESAAPAAPTWNIRLGGPAIARRTTMQYTVVPSPRPGWLLKEDALEA